MLKGIGSALELGAQSALSVFGVRSFYEQPPYEVVGRAGPVEVRRYGPRLAAETTLDPGTREQAFGLLAGYIFGKNRARDGGGAKSAAVETRSEKIAMTTPVEMANAGGRTAMRFFLPRSLTSETAPEPADGRVRVVEVPGETLGVLRFSGSTGDARVATIDIVDPAMGRVIAGEETEVATVGISDTRHKRALRRSGRATYSKKSLPEKSSCSLYETPRRAYEVALCGSAARRR